MTHQANKALPPFDARSGRVWLDGKLIKWNSAKLHVLTHGLHYASCVFEGARAYGGNIFKLNEHSCRLRESSAILGFELPWSAAEIDRACEDVLRANQLTDAYVRPIAWLGSEEMGLCSTACRPHLAIAAWDWPNLFPEEAARRGVRLTMSEWRRPHPQTAPTRAKAAGLYMTSTLATNAARRAGFDDALMLDWRGRVTEATGANIFFLKDGALHTPVPDCFLDGITRRTIIELARAKEMQVAERVIMPEELTEFEHAFLTGTAAEVTPVAAIGSWGFEIGGPVLELRSDYHRLVRCFSQMDSATPSQTSAPRKLPVAAMRNQPAIHHSPDQLGGR